MSSFQHERNDAIAAHATHAPAQIDFARGTHWEDPMENDDRDLDRLDLVSLLMAAVLAALVLVPTFNGGALQMHLL